MKAPTSEIIHQLNLLRGRMRGDEMDQLVSNMRMRFTRWAFGFVVLLATVNHASAQSTQDPLMAEILQRFERRRSLITTLQFDIDSITIRLPRGADVPPGYGLDQESQSSARYHLTIAGDSLRLDYPPPPDWVFDGSPVTRAGPAYLIDIFHEGKTKIFAPEGKDGIIQRINDVRMHFETVTVLYTFDLDNVSLGPHKWEVLNPNFIDADGKRLVHIGNSNYGPTDEIPGFTSQARYEFWLDPARDYVPVRAATMYDAGGVKSMDTLEYVEHPVYGYLPSNATSQSLLPNGDLWIVRDMIIEEFRFNEPVDPSVFEFEFPPGTKVNDKINKVMYVVPEVGGVRRPIPGPDFGLRSRGGGTDAQLAAAVAGASGSPNAFNHSSGTDGMRSGLWGWFAGSAGSRWFFIILLCAAALLIVAGFAYRHARRKA
jgi:hypothetical protein